MLDVTHQIQFWDRKIQNWENRRYRRAKAVIPSRAAFARDLLEQRAKGLRILDLGCGSGQFFRGLDARQFKTLQGVDFSGRAIALAQKSRWPASVSFLKADIDDVDFSDHDFVVGLGLLDWLSDAKLERLAQNLRGKHFLFSYSEAEARGARFLHSAFVHLTYGWRSKGYRPRYFSQGDLKTRFASAASDNLRFAGLPEHPLVGFCFHL